MSAADPIEAFLPALRALCAWLCGVQVPHVVIGGLAVGFLGRPRLTRDIDVVAWLDTAQVEAVFASAVPLGFVLRRDDGLAFSRRHRVLLLRHVPTGIDVDVSLGALPFEMEAIQRATSMTLHDVHFPVSTPEDLIIMKAVAHRDIDLHDVEALLLVHADLDRARIRSWVRQFADVLEMPEIYADVDRLLRQGEKTGRPRGRRRAAPRVTRKVEPPRRRKK